MPATTLAIDTPQTAPPSPSRRPSLLVPPKPRAAAPLFFALLPLAPLVAPPASTPKRPLRLTAARRPYRSAHRIKANGITLIPASYPWSHGGNHDIFFENEVKIVFDSPE
jgi:hypothetical protein